MSAAQPLHSAGATPGPSLDERDAALAAALAHARTFLGSLPQRPVVAPAAQVDAIPDGIGVDAALAHFATRYAPSLSASPGPRYFGFVTGGSTPAALAGDWLAAAYDQNVSHEQGSVAAAIERETARTLARWFGLDPAHDGVFVSGATTSNLVALATARQWAYARLGHDVAEAGLRDAPPIPVLAGAPHASIGKALAVLGLGRRTLEHLATLPGRTALDPAALERRLAALDGAPAIVVASAGEVNTGDFDDLVTIAAMTRRYGAWLHVDGAFGLFAALVPALADRVTGVAAADSVTVDLHKWLNVPYDAAFVYTREPAATRAVFRASAPYLSLANDPLHATPENSRRFRALPAWTSIAAYGRDGVAAMVARGVAQARRLGAAVAASPAFELLDEVRLNIVCFALRDGDAAARDALLAKLAADGRVFMTPTVAFGRPAIRAAFSNWSTSDRDVEIALAALVHALPYRALLA